MIDLKNVFSEKNLTLEFNPFRQNRIYGFTCKNFENDTLISSVHYEVEMICNQSYDNNNSFFFEIDRKQVYVDNTEPDLKIEQIADRCAQAIFPIRIKVSEDVKIMRITNHDDIKKRWPEIKKKLSEYYKGNIVSEILDKFEVTLYDMTLLGQSIFKTWFFHLYFRPLYTTYTKNEALEFIWESPVFGHQMISYAVQQTIEEQYSATDKLFINVKGKSIDKRAINEVLNGYTFPKSEMLAIKMAPLESEMQVQYKLYGEDQSIFSIIGTYQTKISDTKQKITQIEIHHVPENSSFRPSAQPRQENISFWIDQEEPVKKKTGFWSKFF
ncbi:hypothetical protein QWY99_08095 [Flavobacterium branchiarum]|uniref:Uncharacterized protein n=1 Tax=Flavobacterium branchiarum TaxID=1114870 RepID=A0ABV5FS69_9FLAO|nr:hypothetical protein [Flavobacterium branchiarum]MDN3673010.1 hypothetical protein [Flavobacterium branchiarum]